jgi:hypothetical protein
MEPAGDDRRRGRGAILSYPVCAQAQPDCRPWQSRRCRGVRSAFFFSQAGKDRHDLNGEVAVVWMRPRAAVHARYNVGRQDHLRN